jgi:cytochrome c556
MRFNIVFPLAIVVFVGVLLVATSFLVKSPSGVALDPRELVPLPELMRENMLADMRDHIATLNRIISHVADAKFDDAAKLAEQRLGMSSVALHGADHIAPFLPKPMQDIETTMHQAASRLVIVLQAASAATTVEALSGINRALSAVTATCEACHAHYRLH